MKKTIASILFLATAFVAGAQDSYYAEMLSTANYYGTARSIALGNAMTALGGDLGSIGINPAGSAVNNYSQFTISPGIVMSSVASSYSVDGGANFNMPDKVNHSRFNIPNIGINTVMLTGVDQGLKSVAIGLICNNVNSYQRYASATGSNPYTSMTANLACAASGMTPNNLGGALYAGYNAGLFGLYGNDYNYVGAAEAISDNGKYFYVPGTLDQRAVYNTFGTKTDFVVNCGFNFSDKFYLGFNLGVPSGRYRRQESFLESAQNPEQFPVYFSEKQLLTNFKAATTDYRLNTDFDGIYAKFGTIVLPVEGLRLGAAFQFPSTLTINERWQYAAASYFTNSVMDGSANSAQGEYSYTLRTPYVLDLGAAFTIPTLGLVSVDYELMDYSVMRYKNIETDYYDSFVNGFDYTSYADVWYGVNMTNKHFMGLSHSLRVGLEAKIVPEFSVRMGYTFVTSPQKQCSDAEGNRYTIDSYLNDNGNPKTSNLVSSSYIKDTRHALSFGFGYSSPDSFFADLAVRRTAYPASGYSPYYYGNYNVVDKNNKPLNVGSPVVRMEESLWDVVMTLGWRF